MTPFAQFIETMGMTLSLYPLAFVLKPLVEDVLREHKLMDWRKGTILIPPLVIWLVLGLVIRREKSVEGVLEWTISNFRWLKSDIPPENRLVAEGTITKARQRMGTQIFVDLFNKVAGLIPSEQSDFHGRKTASFDGTTMSMADTQANQDKFGKPGSRKGESAYPRMRVMSLMLMKVRMILDISYAPYRGKKTGERNLLRTILARLTQTKLLFLLDAGLYAFDILWMITQKKCDFLLKVPQTVKNIDPLYYLNDGSYITTLYGKTLDPSTSSSERRSWLHHELQVRIIPVHIPGFRPFLLMTTILDASITAQELALHYHQRWDIETAYDEMKTHLCAPIRGHMPTTFRSKRPDLVTQELYALFIVYNTIRYLIWLSADKHNLAPASFSFVTVLSHLVNSAPLLTCMASQPSFDLDHAWSYLLDLISTCPIDRPRRKRSAPRVIKIKLSKFKRKQPDDLSETRDFASELSIPPPPPSGPFLPLSLSSQT